MTSECFLVCIQATDDPMCQTVIGAVNTNNPAGVIRLIADHYIEIYKDWFESYDGGDMVAFLDEEIAKPIVVPEENEDFIDYERNVYKRQEECKKQLLKWFLEALNVFVTPRLLNLTKYRELSSPYTEGENIVVTKIVYYE